jgi:hypothetical protein
MIDWVSIVRPQAAKGLEASEVFRVLCLSSHLTEATSDYQLVSKPKSESAARVHWSMGMGGMFLQYNEARFSYVLNQGAVTLKTAATYQVIPGVLDAGGNAFMNVYGHLLSTSH